MNHKKIFLIALVVLSTNRQSTAGGFQINTQGIKAMTLGGSLASYAADASTVFYNPGGMGFLKKNGITIGGVYLMPQSAYLSPLSGKQVDMKSQTFLPAHFYAAYKINEQFSAGVSFNSPFGLGTEWDNNWEGRYISQKAKLNTYFIQPTGSVNLSENFGVGAGFVYALGNAELTKAIPVASDKTSFGTSNLKGDGHGIGFNIGVYIKSEDKITFAVSYRSKIKIELNNGKASFSDIPSSLASTFPASTTFTTSVKLPSAISLGLSYAITDDIRLHFELDYTGWNVYDSLVFTFPYQYADLNAASHYARNYKNTVAIRLGTNWNVTEKISLRGGVAYDQSPVKDGYVTPDLPDANKVSFAAGISFKLGDKFNIDAGYEFETLKERQDVNTETNLSGSYKTFIHAAGLGINYNF
jgi:long-chain fatty acid transport protein